jgi:hypothetical protein
MFPVREKKVSDIPCPRKKKFQTLQVLFSKHSQSNVCVVGSAEGAGKAKYRSAYMSNDVLSQAEARSSSQAAARYWRRRHGSGPEWTSDPSIPRPSASTTSSRLPVHTTHRAACIGSNREVRIRVSHEVDEISRRQAREPPEFPSSAPNWEHMQAR